MPNIGQDYSSADVGTLLTYAMDFAPLLASGETLASMTPSLGLVLGTDANPASHLSGSASVSGSVASQKIQWTGSALNGNRYTIRFLAVTSAGQTLSAWSYCSIQAPG